jgi:hypothetical protein
MWKTMMEYGFLNFRKCRLIKLISHLNISLPIHLKSLLIYNTGGRRALHPRLAIALLIFVCSCSPQNVSTVSPGVHPNLFLNQAEIDELKAHIASNREPWTSAYREFISQANDALAMSPGSVTDNGGGHVMKTDQPYTSDGVYDPNADRQDYLLADQIGDAILNLGLAYQLTGKSEYADKALQLARVWFLDKKTALRAGTGSNNEIELWITMPAAFYGLDLLWNYPSFPDSDKSALQTWARVSSNRIRQLQQTNNWENWRLVYLMSLAHISGDQAAFNEAIDRWKAIMEFQINDQGLMPEELGRTRSLDYSIFSINPMAQGAEIARHNGVDLYSYRNSHGQGLETALDAYVPYLLDPDSWPYEQISPYDREGVFIYELAYSRYGHKETYKKVIEKYQRPLYDIRTMGYVTLTHGASFDDPVPSPTPLP